MSDKTKAVQKKKEEEKGVVLHDYADHAKEGFEDNTPEDIQIPFITLLQALSPQVQEGTVPGAAAGKMLNSVTDELYPDSIEFVPAFKERAFVEWVDRDHGGGFVARHEKDSEFVAKAKAAAGTRFGKLKSPDDDTHDLVETVYVFGVVCQPDSEPQMAVISFTSTKLKVFRKWNTTMSMLTVPTAGGGKIQPPLFAHRVRISSAQETNKKNQKFFNFRIEPAEGDVARSLLAPDDPRFQAALALRDMVKSGAARAAEEPAGAAPGEGEDGGGAF